MSKTTLFVCSACRFSSHEASRDGVSGGQYLIEQLHQSLTERDLQDAIHLEPVRCMAGCQKPCNVSLTAPGKLTFILSEVSPLDGADALSAFCQQYTACPDGRVPYRERPVAVRQSTAFVLPPFPVD
ncbi:MAG: DUF1636 domain-containing protein [Phormidesmis sp.]